MTGLVRSHRRRSPCGTRRMWPGPGGPGNPARTQGAVPREGGRAPPGTTPGGGVSWGLRGRGSWDVTEEGSKESMRVRARPEPPPRPLSLSSAPGGGLLSLVCPSHEGNWGSECGSAEVTLAPRPGVGSQLNPREAPCRHLVRGACAGEWTGLGVPGPGTLTPLSGLQYRGCSCKAPHLPSSLGSPMRITLGPSP